MSARKPRKPGLPVYDEPRPKLRLLPTVPERVRPEPDPELKAILDDMQRRYKVQRTRITLDDHEPEAA
jgi:hypothetical protein